VSRQGQLGCQARARRFYVPCFPPRAALPRYEQKDFASVQAACRLAAGETMQACAQELANIVGAVVADVLARAYPHAQEASQGAGPGAEEFEEAALAGILKSPHLMARLRVSEATVSRVGVLGNIE